MPTTPAPQTAAQQLATAQLEAFHAAAFTPLTAPWLQGAQHTAASTFAQLGFPTPQVEEWKFTNLAPLARAAFAPAPAAQVSAAHINAVRLNPSAPALVFINGRLSLDHSNVAQLPAGLTFEPLAHGLNLLDDAGQAVLTTPPEARNQALEALSTALLSGGYLLRVTAPVSTPVEIVYCDDGTQAAGASHLHHFIDIAPHASLTLLETWTGTGPSWHNSVTHIHLRDSARLNLIRQQTAAPEAFHTATTHITQGQDSQCMVMLGHSGSRLARHELHSTLTAPGAHCALYGFALARAKQHHDTTLSVTHKAPHCTSDALFRHVADDRGQTVFQGKFHVLPEAQQTDAKMLNQNLLLSPTAKADSKPELEIYADDVKCAHGATCGNLDADSLFYLRSRGLDETTARSLLIEGFIDDLLDRVPDTAAQTRLHRTVHQWLRPEGGRSA